MRTNRIGRRKRWSKSRGQNRRRSYRSIRRKRSYRNYVRRVKKSYNHVPRRIISYKPVMRPIHKIRIKLQQPQYGGYKYGGGHQIDHANSVLWTASWSINNTEVLLCFGIIVNVL